MISVCDEGMHMETDIWYSYENYDMVLKFGHYSTSQKKCLN